jgi:hypothetical protein
MTNARMTNWDAGMPHAAAERVSSTNPRRRGCYRTGDIRGGAALVTSPCSAAA